MRNETRWIDRLPMLLSSDMFVEGWGWKYEDLQSYIVGSANDAVGYVPILALCGSSITGIRVLIQNNQLGKGVKVAGYKRAVQDGAISDTLIFGEFSIVNTGQTGYFVDEVAPWAEIVIETDYAYFIRLISLQSANNTLLASIGIQYKKRML